LKEVKGTAALVVESTASFVLPSDAFDTTLATDFAKMLAAHRQPTQRAGDGGQQHKRLFVCLVTI
jgi:hypothetical protein